MAAGYWMAGKAQETATFELFVRRLPANRDFLVMAGLEQAIEYLTRLRFEERQIAYLQGLPQFERATEGFWEYLRAFRFTGDLFAAPEGSVVFAGEPLLVLRAPLIEAQIPETYLLSTIGFQTLIASKAARIVAAAEGRAVVEFGCRRAHAPEAGCLAGRAAFVAGCAGTSNVEAGFRFGIPVFGTAAHSWVLSFPNEQQAFEKLQHLLGERTIQLIDTYNTIEGAKAAIAVGAPLWGVRLDSGDLLSLSREVRRILDEAGMPQVKIMATNDLDEHTVAALVKNGAAIDVFGVGTSLATSFDAPALSAVYKLVQREDATGAHFPSKLSEGKRTLAGHKQVFRFPDRDLVDVASAQHEGAVPMLRQVIDQGQAIVDEKNVRNIQSYAAQQIAQFGQPGRRIEYSESLMALQGFNKQP
jgi:nicotinate phosphoribosyltransferase